MESISSFSLPLQVYILAVIGIVGLTIGSFLNVAGLRLLSGESLVFPASKCPKCHNAIAWYDNIPVLSYIFLLGKCRKCKEPISIQYPVIEIFTSVLFLAIFFFFGFSIKALFLLLLACGMIVITITDLKEKLIFDISSIPLIPLGLIFNFFDIGHSGLGVVKIPLIGIGHALTLNESFVTALIGAFVGAAFFEVSSRLGLLLVGQYAFGSGDTIIGAALGAWFGWKLILVILVLSFVFQVIVGIPIIIINMYKDKDYKSIAFTSLLLLSMFVPYIGQLLGTGRYLYGAVVTSLISFLFAGIGTVVILQRAKERQSFTFIPFGPALVFGGFLVMFFGQDILNWYISYAAF